jgi:hypothetical protein
MTPISKRKPEMIDWLILALACALACWWITGRKGSRELRVMR